jgi:FkbM family methyltransferase
MAKYYNVVTQSDYGPIIVNRFDNMVGLCISQYGHWEKDEIELLQWLVGACYPEQKDIELLDVGAYVGFHTLGFARFPSAIVHAFEPQRLIFQMLAGTLALNSIDNVHLHHNAVSDCSGATIRYARADYGHEANFGAFEIEPPIKPDFDGSTLADVWESVQTLRIDDLHLQRVRLIKLDVEGMEHKALLGARETLQACRPLVFLEYEKTDFAAVRGLLKESGYIAYYAQRPNILGMPAEITHVKLDGAVRVEL